MLIRWDEPEAPNMTRIARPALLFALLTCGCAREKTLLFRVDVPAASSISVSKDHACVVTRASEVYCWGDADFHHFDDFRGMATGRPARVEVGDGARFVHVASKRVCSATSDTITCWWREFDKSYVWRRKNLDIQSMTMSTSASCWIDTLGVASCEGFFDWREPWSADPNYYLPQTLAAPGPLVGLGIGSGSVSPTSGCMVGSQGWVRCWGTNEAGQLGERSFARSDEQHALEVPSLAGAVEVSVGESHACARLLDGIVVCWGANHGGQSDGIGAAPTIPPTRVEGVSGARQIRLTSFRSCAVVEGGQVACWGTDPSRRDMPWGVAPTLVPGLDDVVDLALSNWFMCAVRSEGDVVCRGRGSEFLRPVLGDVEAVDGEVWHVVLLPAFAGPWAGSLATTLQ